LAVWIGVLFGRVREQWNGQQQQQCMRLCEIIRSMTSDLKPCKHVTWWRVPCFPQDEAGARAQCNDKPLAAVNADHNPLNMFVLPHSLDALPKVCRMKPELEHIAVTSELLCLQLHHPFNPCPLPDCLFPCCHAG
jgi:hypothetical protein